MFSDDEGEEEKEDEYEEEKEAEEEDDEEAEEEQVTESVVVPKTISKERKVQSIESKVLMVHHILLNSIEH